MNLSRLAHVACIALVAVGAAACSVPVDSKPGVDDSLSGAPPVPPPAGGVSVSHEAHSVKPEGFFGAPTINASGNITYVSFNGSNMTPGGTVWVGSWSGSGWLAGTTVTASKGSCSGRFCFLGGTVSGGYVQMSCGAQTTVYAYDYASGTYSNGSSTYVRCIP